LGIWQSPRSRAKLDLLRLVKGNRRGLSLTRV
jgi:hypothetical protein